MKKFMIILVSAFIAFMPLFNINFNKVYADDGLDWIRCQTHDEIVASWKAYLATRNVSYKGSPITFMVSWSYSELSEYANTLGYDMDDIQAGCWYAINNNGFLKFKYSGSAIAVWNAIYARFATQNGLSDIEDSTFTKRIKDGEYFKDDDGNGCLVFQVNSNVQTRINYEQINQYISRFGSPYTLHNGTQYSGEYLFDHTSEGSNTFYLNLNNNQFNYYLVKQDNYNNGVYTNDFLNFKIATSLQYLFYAQGDSYENKNSYLSVFKYNNQYYFGSYNRALYFQNNIWRDEVTYVGILQLTNINSSNFSNAAVDAATEGLKNGIKEMAKGAVVDLAKQGLNEGYESIQDFLEDEDKPDTEEQPTDENGDIINNNIFFIGGINANGNINFEMPDLNNITPKPINNLPSHFLLHGLTQKFPFCIPFDLIAIYEFLDTTPEAPRIQQTIDFGIFNYDLDINLNTYDSAMVNIRKFFVILYIFGLLFVTPQLLK